MVLLVSINPSMDVGHLLDEGWCHHRYIGLSSVGCTCCSCRRAAIQSQTKVGTVYVLYACLQLRRAARSMHGNRGLESAESRPVCGSRHTYLRATVLREAEATHCAVR